MRTRQARASTANQVSFVVGASEDSVLAVYSSAGTAAAVANAIIKYGVGVDSTTTFAQDPVIIYTPTANFASNSGKDPYQFLPSLGAHIVSANELGDGTNANTFNTLSKATLTVSVWM